MANAINRLTNFTNKEYSGQLNIFKGWPSFTIWPFKLSEDRRPTVKVPLSMARLLKLKEFCEKILATEGDIRLSLEIWFYNKELKEEKYEATLAVGRSQGVCYIEACSANHKEFIRFNTVADRCIRDNGAPLANEVSTTDGLKLIIALVDNLIPTAIVTSQAEDGGQAPNSAPPVGGGVPDQVPF